MVFATRGDNDTWRLEATCGIPDVVARLELASDAPSRDALFESTVGAKALEMLLTQLRAQLQTTLNAACVVENFLTQHIGARAYAYVDALIKRKGWDTGITQFVKVNGVFRSKPYETTLKAVEVRDGHTLMFKNTTTQGPQRYLTYDLARGQFITSGLTTCSPTRLVHRDELLATNKAMRTKILCSWQDPDAYTFAQVIFQGRYTTRAEYSFVRTQLSLGTCNTHVWYGRCNNDGIYTHVRNTSTIPAYELTREHGKMFLHKIST